MTTPLPHLIWIDCEMTGLDLASDALVEIAVLVTDSDLNVIGDGVDLVIATTPEKLAVMNEFVTHMHTTSGLITEIPNESKYCVSYGQLKGCYWTIPATSTQGTTKEGDKDYIARVALSANMDLDLHKKVFLRFVEGIK